MPASQFVEARVRARKEMTRMIGGFMVLELCAGWCAQLSGVRVLWEFYAHRRIEESHRNVYYGVFLEFERVYLSLNTLASIAKSRLELIGH